MCLRLYFVQAGQAIRLLSPEDLHGRLLALIPAFANDLRLCPHKAHGETLFPLACLQAANARALPSCAAYYFARTGPSLGFGDIDSRLGAGEEGGGGSFLVRLGFLGRRFEEVVDVVVLVGPLLGLLGCRLVIVEDLCPPAVLGEELVVAFVCVDHCASALRPRSWNESANIVGRRDCIERERGCCWAGGEGSRARDFRRRYTDGA